MLRIAVASAERAIEAWKQEPASRRPLDDEALTHIYLATARLELGEIDGAVQAITPIAGLQSERRTSWIRKRVANLKLFLENGRPCGPLPSDSRRSTARTRHAGLFDEIARWSTEMARDAVTKTVQVRIYDVRPERLEEWIDKFHRLIVPLRHKLGFEIEGSWVDQNRSQHIWIISYTGDVSFDEANATYWSSPERGLLGVDPSEFLLDEETHTVDQVL